jgi:glutathione S-transferase
MAFELVHVSNRTKRTALGGDYRAVSPLGYVPALELDDGAVLLECGAILLAIGDRAPASGLVPPVGTTARDRLHAALIFLATELHKGFSIVFDADAPDASKERARERLARRFDHLAATMGDGHVAGDDYTVADPYLFAILGWCRFGGIELERWPTLAAYQARVAARPSVVAALAAEAARP